MLAVLSSQHGLLRRVITVAQNASMRRRSPNRLLDRLGFCVCADTGTMPSRSMSRCRVVSCADQPSGDDASNLRGDPSLGARAPHSAFLQRAAPHGKHRMTSGWWRRATAQRWEMRSEVNSRDPPLQRPLPLQVPEVAAPAAAPCLAMPRSDDFQGFSVLRRPDRPLKATRTSLTCMHARAYISELIHQNRNMNKQRLLPSSNARLSAESPNRETDS